MAVALLLFCGTLFDLLEKFEEKGQSHDALLKNRSYPKLLQWCRYADRVFSTRKNKNNQVTSKSNKNVMIHANIDSN